MTQWKGVLLDPDGSQLELDDMHSRVITFALDSGASVSFSGNGQNPDLNEIRIRVSDLVMYRDGIKLFRGRFVAQPGATFGDDTQFTYGAADYRSLLDRDLLYKGDLYVYPDADASPLTPTINEVEASDVAWNTLSVMKARASSIIANVTRGLHPTTFNYVGGFADGDTFSEAIRQVADSGSALVGATGFEWDIDADLAFNIYYPLRGNQSSGRVIDSGDFISGSMTPNDAFATEVLVIGGNGHRKMSPVTSPGALATGRWARKVSESNLKFQSQVDARANFIRDQYFENLPTLTLLLKQGAWEGPSDFWLGDRVTVVVDKPGFNKTYSLRVLTMAFGISDDGLEQLNVTFGPRPLPYYSFLGLEKIKYRDEWTAQRQNELNAVDKLKLSVKDERARKKEIRTRYDQTWESNT